MVACGTERELWSPDLDVVDHSYVACGPTRILMIVVHGHLPHHAWHSNRHTARGRNFAQDYVGKRRTCHCATMELIEHGVGQLHLASYGQGSASHDHQHHLGALTFEFLQQLGLSPWERYVGTALGLTRQNGLLASEEEGHVGLLGCR